MTIGRQIKKLGIEDYASEKTPKYTEEQAVKAKKRSRKLVNLLYQSKAEIIIDDEKYFCLNGDNMPGSARYYTDDESKMFRLCSLTSMRSPIPQIFHQLDQ